MIAASYFLNSLLFLSFPGRAFGRVFFIHSRNGSPITRTFFLVSRFRALAPIGAWLAVKGADVSPLEILQMLTLACAVILWLVGFDISYALQDYDFDRSHGLRSLVVAWGPKNALAAMFLAHIR